MENIFKLAIQVAKQSPSKKKVGAVLLKKNRVIATAVNLETKTHPIQALWAEKVGRPEKIFLHAELSALIKAKEKADKIIVARLGGLNYTELRMSKPCPVCSAYLHDCGVEHIYYSITNNKFTYEYWEKND
tara:strand:+ start:2671 stop:3063 length:393 start_codon:yes stop_codon:yes gene_type:complete